MPREDSLYQSCLLGWRWQVCWEWGVLRTNELQLDMNRDIQRAVQRRGGWGICKNSSEKKVITTQDTFGLGSNGRNQYIRTFDSHVILKFHPPVTVLLLPWCLSLCPLLCLLCLNLAQVDGTVVECGRHLPWLRFVVWATQHLCDHSTPGDNIGEEVVWSDKNTVKQTKNYLYNNNNNNNKVPIAKQEQEDLVVGNERRKRRE